MPRQKNSQENFELFVSYLHEVEPLLTEYRSQVARRFPELFLAVLAYAAELSYRPDPKTEPAVQIFLPWEQLSKNEQKFFLIKMWYEQALVDDKFDPCQLLLLMASDVLAIPPELKDRS